MRTLINISALLFSLLLGAPSYSTDFFKGLNAYNNEDFETALKEWEPLSEVGHATAQTHLGVMYSKGEGVTKNYK